MNKTKLTMLSIALLAALALSDTGTAQLGPGMAQVKTKRQHQVVILWASQGGYNSGGAYHYNGAQIWVSSSSAGAPTFPQGSPQVYVQLTELADALAMLLNDGFTITKQSDNGLTYTLIKD